MTDEEHSHDGVVHGHEHAHVTHYLKSGEDWSHLTASHQHEHNHPPVSHGHEAHEDPEKEHAREGHIHDHSQPTESPG